MTRSDRESGIMSELVRTWPESDALDTMAEVLSNCSPSAIRDMFAAWYGDLSRPRMPSDARPDLYRAEDSDPSPSASHCGPPHSWLR